MANNKKRTTEELIDSLAETVAKGFYDIDVKMDQKFDAMQKQIDSRFKQVDRRFEQVNEKFNSIYNILDNHTHLLMENRAQRVATIARFDRIEGEISKIKKKIKIA